MEPVDPKRVSGVNYRILSPLERGGPFCIDLGC